jgi:hypothetical protein
VGTASGNRRLTLFLVAVSLCLSHVLWPDPGDRATAQYAFVLTLGYGHLIGAAMGGRRRSSTRPEYVSPGSWRIFCIVTAATLFAAYFALLDRVSASDFLAVVSPLLALSVWHTVENDLALARAYDRGFALGPIPRTSHFRAIAITTTVLGAVVVLPQVGVSFADLFAVTTLYHLFQWLVFLRDRTAVGSDLAGRSGMLRRIAWSHLPAGLICGVVLIWRSSLPPLAFEVAFSPSLYLFWSSLHVLHTALARGSESLRRPVGAET